MIYQTKTTSKMSISKTIAVIALVAGTQAKDLPKVTLVEHHNTQIQCKEIDGFVKDCEEGLNELVGYLSDVTSVFKRSKDATIQPLADSLIDQFHAFDQLSNDYREPFMAPAGKWHKYVNTVNKLRLAVKASRDWKVKRPAEARVNQFIMLSKVCRVEAKWPKKKMEEEEDMEMEDFEAMQF